ncbi:class C sortase [Streptococcus sp. zg-86]|uniref:Class C sortase n=1 Tax=Streptococcus zhangguiae TaxID=2664091 RepID=A0A6I4RBY3_9STRE|nr:MULTISPECIES: class C sortase [unclassified Streptococcus]MTB65077.1 class C sortase [Streptococcus sp. zg-86]MTB91236.1 class C sortase [Streptococcus sp. zg-36]MWV57009.1 class C sortase [Streptococcus sp. zg-70]QTH47569.1 class C sortase [Streptococcus sp. zg-86]
MRKRNRQKKSRKFLIAIFLLGFGIMLFPIVSQIMYYHASRVTVREFNKQASTIDTSEIERRMSLAQAYNETHLIQNGIQDVFTRRQKEGLKEYARMLEVNEQIGYVSIPKISQELPIYAGTTETVLQKGVGHLEATSLPIGGASTHSVLTAHRGLPTARLFTDLDKVKKGDLFYVRNIKETLAYRVISIKVVEPSDLKSIAIEEGKDYVTLLTCTPYMINSHRLLVTGERTEYVIEEQSEQKKANQVDFYKYLFYFNSTLVLIVVIIIIRYRQQVTKKRKRIYRK